MSGKEYCDLYAWIEKRKTKVGYGVTTTEQTLRIKADSHLDPAKLGRALMAGMEVIKRMPKKTAAQAGIGYQSAEDGFTTPKRQSEKGDFVAMDFSEDDPF